MRRTYVLAILDGWGIGEANESNPIYVAEPKTIKYIEENFPVGALQASGIAVGLPWNEEGNSEVGNLTIGAGKTLYQHFPRISLAVRDGSFFENKSLVGAFSHAAKNNSAVHLIGLLTEGNVHASFEHVKALIELAKKENCKKLYLQLFTDGKDGPPHSASNLVKKLGEEIKKSGIGEIVSLSGRYFAMDRDNHWERTEKAYRALTEFRGGKIPVVEEFFKKSYEGNLNDEFIEPTPVNESHPVQSNDALIFFNFREDSMRQIVEPFLNSAFEKFPAKKFEDLFVATMTAYSEKFGAKVAFPPEKVGVPLGKTLADNNKIQLRLAETEKYAHVTYFFNGLKESPYPSEYRVLIPSRSTARHDENPEMMAQAITDRVLAALNEGGFDFIVVNYANPDIIAHTGNLEATVKAIKAVDKEIERLMKATLENNHILLITADHGNAEKLINPESGEPETKHNPSPVPIYLVGNEFKRIRKSSVGRLKIIGLLSDVAPTILDLMKIPKPKEMTGESLLGQLLG